MLKRPELKIIVFLAIFILVFIALRSYLEKCDQDNMHARIIETMPYTTSYDLSQQILSYFRDKNGSKDRRSVERLYRILILERPQVYLR